MGVFTIGLDFGQEQDYTAVIVTEGELRRYVSQRDDFWEPYFRVHHIERMPLGTPFAIPPTRTVKTTVSGRVKEIATRLGKHARRRPWLYVDATGLGRPILEPLRVDLDAFLVPVVFTAGEKLVKETDRPEAPATQGGFVIGGTRLTGIKLGKGYMVSMLAGLLQSGRLKFPAHAQARELKTLIHELRNYRAQKTSEDSSHTSYGSFSTTIHDDLVTALGLACLREPPRDDGQAIDLSGRSDGWRDVSEERSLGLDRLVPPLRLANLGQKVGWGNW